MAHIHSKPEMYPSLELAQQNVQSTLVKSMPFSLTDRFLNVVSATWSPYSLRSATPFWMILVHTGLKRTSIVSIEQKKSLNGAQNDMAYTTLQEILDISPDIEQFPHAEWTVSGKIAVLWATEDSIRLQILRPSPLGSQPRHDPEGRLVGRFPGGQNTRRPRLCLSPWTESLVYISRKDAERSEAILWSFC